MCTRLPSPDCSGLLGRTSLRRMGKAPPYSPVPPNCSGLLGRTSLRPTARAGKDVVREHCSGLLGRTSLRQNLVHLCLLLEELLFRPSRPDFIETENTRATPTPRFRLFRPSRPDFIETTGTVRLAPAWGADCSGLLGRTSLRHHGEVNDPILVVVLFRPSRPDFIETSSRPANTKRAETIVPAF